MKKETPWKLTYDKFNLAEEGLRESLCALGNGYFGTRGSAYESMAGRFHYPGTYVAGLYNRLPTHIAGRTILNEDLVNCPNWCFLTFKIGDGGWVYPSTVNMLSYRQELDMHGGVLSRKMRFKDYQGRRTLVETKRIVSMDNHHCGAFEYIITPENYSEWITVRTMLDGTVLNTGVERYKQLNSKHWISRSLGSFPKNGIYLTMRTSQSRIELCQAATIRVFVANKEKRFSVKHLMKGKERIGQEFRIFAREKTSYNIEKITYIYSSRDSGIKNPQSSSLEAAKKPHRFSTLLKNHEQAWEGLWEKSDVVIEGDAFSQRVMRLHLFHLMQTASPHNAKIDAGLPARGLGGEAYRGHIFWDSIFTMPFYDLHLPDVSKALLTYRYKRLPKAREYAREKGYEGAMIPWQSGSSGREETQVVHLNPLSGKWGLDHSSNQRHVSIAIAYNVWNYWKRTKDISFLKRYGAEIVLSIAQFLSSLVRYDARDKRYHTKGIMGPDEFHEKFPGYKKPGLKDNAYTNLMIAWVLTKAQETFLLLPEKTRQRLMERLRFSNKDVARWEHIAERMNVIIGEDGVISQFLGYFDLKELDWDGYRAEYGNIHRMDRILKAEGKSPDEYKLSKQADVLMLFYLLPFSELKKLFNQLGYDFDKNMVRKNYEYYVKRTSHGSTLSRVVHSLVALQLGKHQVGWRLFKEVLDSDINDAQGGTTPEGIHVGVMGGSFVIAMKGFAGINILDDRVSIEPNLPKQWKNIKFKLAFQDRLISLFITQKAILISVIDQKEDLTPLCFEIKGKLHKLSPNKKLQIAYR